MKSEKQKGKKEQEKNLQMEKVVDSEWTAIKGENSSEIATVF